MSSSNLNIILDKIYDLANNSDKNPSLLLGEDEVLNSIIGAVNYLEGKCREQKKQTIANNNSRLLDMQEVLNSYLSRDFTPRAKISNDQDEIDALALSVNYFGKEMMDSFERLENQQLYLEEFNQILEEKVKLRTSDLENTQKELESSLKKEKELGELKSRFVATASHQFRTPLSVIQSNFGLLNLYEGQLDGELKPIFSKIYNRVCGQIEKMTGLMDEVLILEKINEGNKKPNAKPINLIDLCKEVLFNYNQIQNDFRKMEIIVNGDFSPINLDREQVENAISNLVSNAFKYSQGHSPPSLTIDFNEAEIQISIKDNGIGIPNKELKHLFEPFYRASNVREISGSGLGITISKEYIEMNNGKISVKSKENDGTEFIVKFKK
ncbi:MAG: signal transduction histidine kinase [Crocinitomicaceae bacterium]|jgi:signal transduction histidine kinase